MQTISIPAYVQFPRAGIPNKIVYHDPGQPNPLKGVSARGVANFNALPPSQRNPPGEGGYHRLGDATTHVIGAADDMIVYGATHVNHDGLHFCFCDYSDATLELAASVTLGWAAKYHIPLVQQDVAHFPAPGLYAHATTEIAVQDPAGHTDPRLFPWDTFMQLLRGDTKPPAPTPTPGGDDAMPDVYVDTQSKPFGARLAVVGSAGDFTVWGGAHIFANGSPVEAEHSPFGLLIRAKYPPGERYIGSAPWGNGFQLLSIKPDGTTGERYYSFVPTQRT